MYNREHFSEDEARFYIAEVAVALDHLHKVLKRTHFQFHICNFTLCNAFAVFLFLNTYSARNIVPSIMWRGFCKEELSQLLDLPGRGIGENISSTLTELDPGMSCHSFGKGSLKKDIGTHTIQNHMKYCQFIP